jgi:hypothetical protein
MTNTCMFKECLNQEAYQVSRNLHEHHDTRSLQYLSVCHVCGIKMTAGSSEAEFWWAEIQMNTLKPSGNYMYHLH